MPCLLPAWAIITLPLADILNLFFAELFVFSLGIILRTYTKNVVNLQLQLKLIKVELPLSFAFHQIWDVILPFQSPSYPLLSLSLVHCLNESVEVLDL